MSKDKKQTATQRIEGLEQTILSQTAQIEELANVCDEIDRKFIALTKRVNASITASSSNDEVDKLIQAENEKELIKLTEMLVKQRVLIDNSEGEVTEASFVVGRHVSSEGNEVNPRLQFYAGSLVEGERNKFLGKKLGDMIESDDKSISIEITELYKVQNPDMEVNFDESSEGQTASDSE